MGGGVLENNHWVVRDVQPPEVKIQSILVKIYISKSLLELDDRFNYVSQQSFESLVNKYYASWYQFQSLFSDFFEFSRCSLSTVFSSTAVSVQELNNYSVPGLIGLLLATQGGHSFFRPPRPSQFLLPNCCLNIYSYQHKKSHI